MSKRVRGKLYVDKDVQRALIWQLLRHWALFVTILTAMLVGIEMLKSGPSLSLKAYLQATWSNNAPLFLLIVTLLPWFVFDSIKLSHRFVGPIIRVRRALRELAQGETVAPIKFRDGDFWQDCAVHFNVLLKRLPPADAERDSADDAGELVACGPAEESREMRA